MSFPNGLTHDEIQVALTNIGYPVDCSACMEIFYCGSSIHLHTCPQQEEKTVSVTTIDHDQTLYFDVRDQDEI